MFVVPAVLGGLALCAIYAVVVRVVSRAWIALCLTVVLGITVPQVAFSRDTFSETSTQFLLWVGVWLALEAWAQRNQKGGAQLLRCILAGLALGGTAMTRIDAIVYVSALPVLAAGTHVVVRSRGEQPLRFFVGIAIGLLPPLILGSIDLMELSGQYYHDLRGSHGTSFATYAEHYFQRVHSRDRAVHCP